MGYSHSTNSIYSVQYFTLANFFDKFVRHFCITFPEERYLHAYDKLRNVLTGKMSTRLICTKPNDYNQNSHYKKMILEILYIAFTHKKT